MSRQAKQAASMYSIENTTGIILEHYQEIWDKFVGRKRGFFSRILQPFKRIKN